MSKFVTVKELRKYGVPYSRRHIDRLEAAGKFPKRVKFGKRKVEWEEGAIIAWVEAFVTATRERDTWDRNAAIEQQKKKGPTSEPPSQILRHRR